MGDPGGLIGSISPHHETLTASTKSPNPSTTGSAGSHIQLPPPDISVSGGEHATPFGSASGGSQALGGSVRPSGNTTSSGPASGQSSPAVPSSSGPTAPTIPTSPANPIHNAARRPLSPEITAEISAILKGRETPRGLVTMLPSALFERRSALLAQTGNDKLSRIAGVIVAHPGLKVEVDGYTGSSDVFESGLSIGRAASVRLFLLSQGINESDVVQKSVTVPASQIAAAVELSLDVALVISEPR